MARKDDFEEQIRKDIEEELNSRNSTQKVLNAFKKAEMHINKDIEYLIQQYMVDLYYGDYTPTHYQRTWQLRKTVQPWSEMEIMPTGFSFDFDYTRYEQNIDGSEGNPLWLKMNHGTYKVKMSYKTKKGKTNHYEYTIKPNPKMTAKQAAKREKRISDNFLKNIHGRKGIKGSHNIEQEIADAIERLVEDKLDIYIEDELRKIL